MPALFAAADFAETDDALVGHEFEDGAQEVTGWTPVLWRSCALSGMATQRTFMSMIFMASGLD